MPKLFVCPNGHNTLESTQDRTRVTDWSGHCPICDVRGFWMLLPPGYQMLGHLGKGGMGIVIKAQQKNPSRIVALKLVKPMFQTEPDQMERLYNEATALQRLDHPNIVHVLEVGQTQGIPYLTLEHVDGGSVKELYKRVGRLEPKRALKIMEPVARAINFVHGHGIIHRDMKPANILLDKQETPKVTDFGLAKFLQEDRDLTRAGVIMGTVAYMPPEQAHGESSIGPHSDIYSIGVVLYELLTGHKPFTGRTTIELVINISTKRPPRPTSLCEEISPELEAVILRCLEKDPEDRFPSAAALADDLAAILEGERVQTRLDLRADSEAPVSTFEAEEDSAVIEKQLDEERYAGPIPEVAYVPSGSTLPSKASGSDAADAETESSLELPEQSLSGSVYKPGQSETLRFNRVGLLSGLDTDQIDALLSSGYYREFEEGDIIFNKGDIAHGMNIIIKGQVEVFREENLLVKSLAMLGPAEVFGEFGLLLPEGNRTASARATELTTLLEIPGNPIKLLKVFSDPKVAVRFLQNLMSILRQRLLTKSASGQIIAGEEPPATAKSESAEHQVKALYQALTVGLRRRMVAIERLEQGEFLFKENAESDGFYYLHEGEVFVVKQQDDGTEQKIARVRAPNIIGELGFFSGEKRTAGIQASTPIMYSKFSDGDFRQVKRSDPKGAVDILFAALQFVAYLIVETPD